MGHYFKWLGSREGARGLWENKESLQKYLNHLRDLMMANPDSRMTDDETEGAARIRAELFNSGLRGQYLVTALKDRLLSAHGFNEEDPVTSGDEVDPTAIGTERCSGYSKPVSGGTEESPG